MTTLNNPLNVTLLTSQLLSAPAIWTQPEGLRTSTRTLSVFHSAAQALIKHERALRDKSADVDLPDLQLERTLPKNEWIKSVISGADEHSPRWRHLLVLGGLLLGFGPVDEENLSRSMRGTIETALVTATNLALEETAEDDELGHVSLAVVLNHCVPSLSDIERGQINYDALLPVLMQAMLHSSESLRSGYFLGTIDVDVRQISKDQFEWSDRSSSFQAIQNMLASPLISTLGPLSRLISHAVERVHQSSFVLRALDDLEAFARTLQVQWRQNKLSEIDQAEEARYLGRSTVEQMLPQLWKLLRTTLFAVVVVLRSAIGRILSDGVLASHEGSNKMTLCITELTDPQIVAPNLASQALRILRNLYFISTRSGSTSFSQYTFVYLTALDTMCAYPPQAEIFLHSIKPLAVEGIPLHPLDRNLDLFFLNTAEHCTLILPPQTNEELLVATATRYLATEESNLMLPIFEAAHSVMLAVFSAPQNAEPTKRQLPFYVQALFSVFPENVSARQFRLAFKTLLRLTSPPSLLAESEPMLPATLLELLHDRAISASSAPLPAKSIEGLPEDEASVQQSEQLVLVLTIIDTLVQLPLDMLDEWLPLAAELVHVIHDNAMREHCKQHFWQTLVGGEMDPDRSGVCHDWWSTRGGRELLLYSPNDESNPKYEMSGALPEEAIDSKL